MNMCTFKPKINNYYNMTKNPKIRRVSKNLGEQKSFELYSNARMKEYEI